MSTKIETDVNAQVQSVLKESYLEATELLKVYADKVRAFNDQKKAIREYLHALREYRERVMSAAREQGINLCSNEKEDLEILAKLLEDHAYAYEIGPAEYEMCIPDRVPDKEVNDITILNDQIEGWDARLIALAATSERLAFDLQNAHQKQQQALQMMSNISKMAHDAAMAIIQNMR